MRWSLLLWWSSTCRHCLEFHPLNASCSDCVQEVWSGLLWINQLEGIQNGLFDSFLSFTSSHVLTCCSTCVFCQIFSSRMIFLQLCVELGHEVSDSECLIISKLLDVNGDGTLSMKEFKSWSTWVVLYSIMFSDAHSFWNLECPSYILPTFVLMHRLINMSLIVPLF